MEKELELAGDLIKILLPAGIVLYAMYLTLKSFLAKDFEKKLIDIKLKNTELVLPVRLQAYERMCLFLERISPHNMIVRVNDPSYNVAQLHQVLLNEIREEYAHNMSQQIYMSDNAWQLVKSSRDEIVNIINNASQGVPREARGIELAKQILNKLLELPEDPSSKALKYLKNEIRQIF
jgi:hypothetical protein